MTEYKCFSAESCQFGDMCKPPFDIGGCSHFKPNKPMTNFENITKSEESLAEWLGDLLDNDVCEPSNWNCKKCFKWCHRDKVVEWLKKPHKGSDAE